jgi:hypothetical protein
MVLDKRAAIRVESRLLADVAECQSHTGTLGGLVRELLKAWCVCEREGRHEVNVTYLENAAGYQMREEREREGTVYRQRTSV